MKADFWTLPAKGNVIEYSLLGTVFFLALSPLVSTICLLIGGLVWLYKLYQTRGRAFKRTPFDVAIAAFAAAGAVSILFSPDKMFSFYNYYNLMGKYLLIYYLTVQNIEQEIQLKRLLMMLFASSVCVVLYGYYQYIHGIDVTAMRWVDGDQFPELKTRVFSTLQNPNILAGYLLVMMSLAFGVACKLKKISQRLPFAALFLLQGICLYMTACRGAWLSLLAVILVYCFFQQKRLFYLLVIFAVAVFCFDNSVSQRIMTAFQAGDTSSEMRIALWESTIAMITDNPLFGIGWGAYWMVYPEYDFYIQNEAVKIVHAHNMYLNFMAETGMVGFAAFMTCLLGHLSLAAHSTALRQSQFLNGIILGAVLSLFCIMLNGFTDYVLFNIELSTLFWLVNAVIVLICRRRLR